MPDDATPQPTDLFVATMGTDENSGTSEAPLATLEKARDTLRIRRQAGELPATGCTVWIRGGVYPRTQGFKLTAEDSGAANAPIVYRAYPKETVRLLGGHQLTGARKTVAPAVLNRLPPSARGQVYEIDLDANGITDLGQIQPMGFLKPVQPVQPELSFNSQPMQIARFPNIGWLKIADIPTGPAGGQFTIASNAIPRLTIWSDIPDIWLHGFWNCEWADSFEKVNRIDTDNQTIILEEPGAIFRGIKSKQRFYALNILEELDSKGEYYIDRDNLRLYFWPPATLKEKSLVLSDLRDPFVTLSQTSHTTIHGLIFDSSRGGGIQITGGTNNLVAGCTFRNLGTVAVIIDGNSVSNGVAGCDIYEVGQGGISLSGGSREQLTPGNNFAVNNHIFNYNRICQTYRAGIKIEGVGNRVAHNWIHSAPHFAIYLFGNDHVIEYNEINNVCLDTDDVGAFYMGRDISEQGNTIRYNLFRNIPSARWRFAIYLDDFASGTTILGNVFYKVPVGVRIHGGHQNLIANNLFLNCSQSSTIGFGPKQFIPLLQTRLSAVNAAVPPYSERYPALGGIATNPPLKPTGNVYRRNIAWPSKGIPEDVWYGRLANFQFESEDNFFAAEPQVVNPAALDFRIPASSPALTNGFAPIPSEKIGLYRDQYRPRIRLEP